MRKMSKITGLEAPNQVPPKVTAMYRAVSTLLREDKDISEMSVSMITGLAGIGKGTAYEYFDSKEEIDRKSTRLNSSHRLESRMPSSA